METNSFGQPIPAPRELLKFSPLADLLRGQMHRILYRRAGLNKQAATDLAQEIFSFTRRRAKPLNVARALGALLAERGLLQSLRGDLPDRARRMADQVKPFLQGRAVLDFGCGNGEVGLALQGDGYDVALDDIVDTRSPAARGLPFALDRQTPPDNLLVLNVLHHADEPPAALRAVAARQAGRIILIESVYAVAPCEIPAAERRRLIAENPSAAVWLTFAAAQQFAYNAFWDWFFAQVINEMPRVPFNYQRADEWRAHFVAAGYRETRRRWLGIDQPLVPEFHVLMVFDRDR